MLCILCLLHWLPDKCVVFIFPVCLCVTYNCFLLQCYHRLLYHHEFVLYVANMNCAVGVERMICGLCVCDMIVIMCCVLQIVCCVF